MLALKSVYIYRNISVANCFEMGPKFFTGQIDQIRRAENCWQSLHASLAKHTSGGPDSSV